MKISNHLKQEYWKRMLINCSLYLEFFYFYFNCLSKPGTEKFYYIYLFVLCTAIMARDTEWRFSVRRKSEFVEVGEEI